MKAEKGPADLRDLPEHFGQAALREEYGAHDIRIFAEINNVPYLPREEVVRLAEYYRASGADVIDLGCSLDRKFGDVGEVVSLLRARGFSLSIDTLDPVEILAADRAGVDYVLSLNGQNLDVARELRATPVLIPDSPQELGTLDRSRRRSSRRSAGPTSWTRSSSRSGSDSPRRSTATSRCGRATRPPRC